MDLIFNNLLLFFYVVSIFLFLLTTFMSIVKAYDYLLEKKNNFIVIGDLEKGIKFSKFMRELEMIEEQSSLAKILLTGHKYFMDAYSAQKYNYGSPILLAKTAMKERLQRSIICKEKYLGFFAFNSILSIHLGAIIFLLEIYSSFGQNELFFNCVISNLNILIISLGISLYSSLFYVFFKNSSLKYGSSMKGYIEGYLKYMHKEIILKNE